MGIYIKGMEMPTGNDELRLIIRSNGQVIISHETYYEEAEAVPVPPYGRLIDADALLAKHYGRFGTIDEVAREAIKNAPTIIPAEEGE